ncbi:hypothetical protein GCM10011490_29170 [Pseudoclavibacter endophyticus]|uniref:Uncharacterized protein n=1 Tax=Pseudoclavibacter endophyticus TaxID=1778590 RepID=A0A6H9WIX9_9MICO|nr:hypothetical protein [Pseudoclavibacter endophyticus]KAB1646676.1 hypothetical protein F8O04_13045 [Pseudoclavibacter endophyticus]GGA76567.1 hypothetical protein GCM10011490_29170 [Pseudoclavibacter endophyticus]
MPSIDPIENWQVSHLAAMTPEALLELFGELQPPEPGELVGEYAGVDYLGRTEASFAAALGRVLGGGGWFWLGKAFPGTEGDGASGYNRVVNDDREVARRDRYGIAFGDSPFDGKPSLLLKYSDFDNAAGSIGFLDEVRKVNDRLFLCTGRADEGKGEVGFFFLVGPATPFVGVDDPNSELLVGSPA